MAARIAWPNGVHPEPVASPDAAAVLHYDGDRSRSATDRLNEIISAGAFEAHIAHTFALEQVRDAHLFLRDHYVGKLLLSLMSPPVFS